MKDMGIYYSIDVEQGSPDWLYMKKGSITGSNIGKILGHAPFCDYTNERLAEILTGNYKEEFTKEAIDRMNKGTNNEPFIRNYLAKLLNVEIKLDKFNIYKKNPLFRGSLDGIIDDDTFIEIKSPAYMYEDIVEHMKEEKEDSDISHFFRNRRYQYDQIIMYGAITGRKNCIYCVYSHKDKKIFIQKIPIDLNYWNKCYEEALIFYNQYMKKYIK